ncbi:hypothetical protein U3516DRAFT_654860 [Neocallimastix sp. 'constans']
MKEKLNFKSKLLSDILDLNSTDSDMDKSNKVSTSKSSSNYRNKSNSNNKTSISNISVSVNKRIPRNQRWKKTLINKIEKDILSNETGSLTNILQKRINEKKEKKEEEENDDTNRRVLRNRIKEKVLRE